MWVQKLMDGRPPLRRRVHTNPSAAPAGGACRHPLAVAGQARPGQECLRCRAPVHRLRHDVDWALEVGKHVMCTVPMAASVDDCRRIVGLSEKTGLKYLLAETVVYAPPPGRKPQA